MQSLAHGGGAEFMGAALTEEEEEAEGERGFPGTGRGSRPYLAADLGDLGRSMPRPASVFSPAT